MILKERYVENEVYSRELQGIFSSRFFVGAGADFSQEGSYHSFLLGREYALTCRYYDDKVRAFNNVCLHRNCLIDPPGRGVRRFRCGYHGWQYDKYGELREAPSFDISKIRHKQLVEFPVVDQDGFFFVGLRGAPDVAEVAVLVQKMGLSLLEPAFYADETVHQCNWKLLVENVLDREHLSQVHGTSFVSAGMDSSAPVMAGGANYTLWSRTEPEDSGISHGLKHFRGARHHYLHGYVFPNLFLANTNNMIGFVNQLIPLNANRSLLRWQLYELPALIAQPGVVREQVKKDAIIFAEKVILEDRQVVEMCQQGLSVAGPSLQIQAQEEQILRFHAMYNKALS